MVIGIDIDQRLVKNAIENIHRVINTESTIEILDQKDEFMEEDEGSHTKLIELLSKTKNLPKSLQLSLQQENLFLKQNLDKKGIGKVKEKLY